MLLRRLARVELRAIHTFAAARRIPVPRLERGRRTMATLPTNPVGAATDLTVDGPTQTYPALLPVESHRPTAYPFGVISIPATSVFFATRLSYASVNQSPIMPGHVLIMPRSNVPRVHMMRSDEVADIWLTAQHVARVLEERLKAAAMTFAIQDGAEAGQKIPCVHIHVIPRQPHDLVNKDDIYDMIEQNVPASTLGVASSALPPPNTRLGPAPTGSSVVPDPTFAPSGQSMRESLDDTKRVFHSRAEQAVEATMFANWLQEAGLPQHLQEA